jgi:cellulase
MNEQMPVTDAASWPNGLYGSNMTCGWLPFAANPSPAKCPVAAGQNIGLRWFHGVGFPDGDYVANSHWGSIRVYMAKSNTGAGDVWFKVYEAGIIDYTGNGDAIWASPELLNRQQGTIYFDVPSDITAGNYLIRGELTSLHGVGDFHGVQTYVRCAELTVSGGGAKNPQGVSFPGAYSYEHPGLTFNPFTFLENPRPYPQPGPPVYVSGGVTVIVTTSTGQPLGSTTTTGGTVYEEGVVINVLVTVTLLTSPTAIQLNLFIGEVVDVLAIPKAALKDVTVDFDRCTETTTVVQFTITNSKKNDGSYVDPIAAAFSLKTKADNRAPELDNTFYLKGMQVNIEKSSASFIQVCSVLIVALIALLL